MPKKSGTYVHTYTRRRRKILPGFPWKGTFQTKEEVDAYFAGDKIQCLLCGKWYKKVSGTHLAYIHEITDDEYRERYGLPWTRGLVGKNLHETFGKNAKQRLADGTLTQADEELQQKATASPHRPPQPFLKDFQRRRMVALCGRKTPWQREDYEAILTRMQEQQRLLHDVCQDPDLPSQTSWRTFVRKHPEFARRAHQIYRSFPYSLQIRSPYKDSPQFRIDCQRLRARGMTYKEIAKVLGVSLKAVGRVLRRTGAPQRRTISWQQKDYEAILTRMQEQQHLLSDVCQDPDLPSAGAWRNFVEKHPEFSERAQKICQSFPYSIQVRSGRNVSPQFQIDCQRLRAQGMTLKHIAKALEVSPKAVSQALRRAASAGKSERGRSATARHSRTTPWQQKDYEAILTRMQKEQRTLGDVLQDPDLPGEGAWRNFVKSHPEFVAEAHRIHFSLPYSVQLRSRRNVSPQFRIDCQRLRDRGMTHKEIAKALGVTEYAVSRVVPGVQPEKLTIEEMRQLAERRGGKCLSDLYINNKTKLIWECQEGHKWAAQPDHIKGGKWCPLCAREKRAEAGRLGIEKMRQIAESRGGKCLSETYRNYATKLLWECAKGHQWEAAPANLRHGQWCPYCAGNTTLTIEDMQRIAKGRGGRCLSVAYTNNRTKLVWQCAQGHQWEAPPKNVKRGSWCPHCANNNRRKRNRL